MVALGSALLHRVVNSPFGRVLTAIRENPERAEFIGDFAERIDFRHNSGRSFAMREPDKLDFPALPGAAHILRVNRAAKRRGNPVNFRSRAFGNFGRAHGGVGRKHLGSHVDGDQPVARDGCSGNFWNIIPERLFPALEIHGSREGRQHHELRERKPRLMG